MADPRVVDYHRAGRVGTVTMGSPDGLNAVNTLWIDQWCEAMDAIEGDDEVAAVVVRSTGRVFSAGGDLKAPMWDLPVEQRLHDMRRAYELSKRIQRSHAVFVAAVNGPCVGAATSLALACDFRVADEDARFSLDFVKLGLLPDMGGTWLLGRVLPLPRALEMALLGDPVDAATALAWGLVLSVEPRGSVHAAAHRLAETLASRPPLALRAVKRGVRSLAQAPMDEGYAEEMAELIRLMGTEDCAEAVRAWVERRPPRFRGR